MKHYTEDELNQMRQLKSEGASYDDLAKMFNRSARALQVKFSELGWVKQNREETCSPAKSEEKVVKQKTLNDFQPRDMIKHLYDLGCRIRNNKLVFEYVQVVNMKDILEG